MTISAGALAVSSTTANTGTFRVAGGTYTISTTSAFTNNGTVTISGGALQWSATGGGADYKGTGTTNMTGGLLKIGHDYQANQMNASGGTVEFQVGTGPGNLTAGGSYQFYNVQLDAVTFLSNPTTFSVAGNWDNRAAGQTLDAGSTAIFNGSSAQVIGSTEATTFANLTVNNSNGVSLSKDATVQGTLLFISGKITTGANTLTIGKDNGHLGTVSASPAGYIIGNLKKFVANGSNPTTFEVGTAPFYTPLTMDPIGNIGGTNNQSALLARATAGEHPSINSSGIKSARDVNSYWSITAVGDTSWHVASTGYTITGFFPSGNVDAGANTAAFIIKRFLSPNWASSPDGTGVTRTPTSAQASVTFGANTGSLLAFGDFAIGEPGISGINADLSNLTLSAAPLTPAFASGTTNYTASVSNAVASITETPTAADATASITVNGSPVASGSASQSISLNVGNNVITTVVTAEDGTTKTYTVAVTRAPSPNADLSNLALSAGTLAPAFSSATTSYMATVSNTTTSLTETPTAADATATITVNGSPVASGTASQSISLNVGNNVITTVVTAQDGTTTNTYTVTVTRAPSSNADLSNLTLSEGTLTPAFDSGTTSYTASVSNATTNITETPTAADATATITVNGSPVASGSASQSISLNVGSNVITTVVTAEDGTTTKTYTVTVTRAASVNADLFDLVLSSGTLTPAFDSGTTSYTANVSNATTSITETPTAADATATITVNGLPVASGSPSQSISLNVGSNVITTVVTAEDGTTTKTYTVDVTRAPHLPPVVRNTNDSGVDSLRQALLEAEDNETITFNIPTTDPGYSNGVWTISLTSGELVVDKNVTIDGLGANVLTVRRDPSAPAFRIFTINSGLSTRSQEAPNLAPTGVTIKGMTISNGLAFGTFPASAGAGIYNDHTNLAVEGCALTGNSAATNGGGIFSNGSSGGSATLTVTKSTLSGNSADFGGGIYNFGTGGAASLTITNSTLSGNSATSNAGGAVVNDGQSGTATLSVTSSTLIADSATNGEGIYNQFGTAAVANTILATGPGRVNIVNTGSLTSSGYNLSSDDGSGFLNATGDQINTDPVLGPLKDNGGTTLTHAPLSNSPAIDMGKDMGATGQCQTGEARPITYDLSIVPPADGDRSDIGAVELAPGVRPTSAVSRKTHGAAGDFDIDLGTTGLVAVECRTGGATNDYKVVLTFASPVTFSSAAVNDGTGSVESATGSGTNSVTINLTGVTDAQRMTLALFDVDDTVNKGDLGLFLRVLVGDVSGNGFVNSGDTVQTRLHSGETTDSTNFRSDVNANGFANSGDTILVRARSGNAVQ